MAQEEQNQRYSNSSSGGGCGIKSSKKLKQKKIPQRGLGVAQLEKIRLEEQQIKDAASSILSSPSTVSPNNNSSYLSVPPLPNYKHNQSSSLVPLPPSSLLDVSLPNSLVRSSPSNNVPLTNPSNCVGFGTGWPSIPVKGRGNIPKLWNCEYNLDGENQNIDPGFAFRTNIPYEDSPIWPLSNVIQRTQQYQRSSSMVISSATSSSLLNIHMEPPSNQSYYGNYTPLWPEEEKIVGMKRPYPFSLDNPPVPSFHCKLPRSAAPICRSDESTSCGNGGPCSFDPRNPIFREIPSCTTSEQNFKKGVTENVVLNGDFLTLAPPTTMPYSSLKFNHSSAHLASHNGELGSLPYQESTEEEQRIIRSSGSAQQHPFYSFIPPAKSQIYHSTSSYKYCNGEIGESVDLNLKL